MPDFMKLHNDRIVVSVQALNYALTIYGVEPATILSVVDTLRRMEQLPVEKAANDLLQKATARKPAR